MSKELVLKFLDEYLKIEKGFRRNASTWYLRENKKLILVNYQKSLYDQAFYLNFGVFYERLAGEKQKPPHPGHWQFTMELYSFLSYLKNEKQTDLLTPINYNIPPEELTKKLNKIIDNIDKLILPFLFNLIDYKYMLDHDFPRKFNPGVIFTQYFSHQALTDFFTKEIAGGH